jgi:hypothetical protein
MAALLKLTFIFVGIVLLLSRKWNLGLVLLLASVAIGLLFGYPLVQVGPWPSASSSATPSCKSGAMCS